MKVFIFTEGGRNIGFGHITRCISLYQAFEERKIMPKLLVNGDSNVKILLNGLNYQIFNWLKKKKETYKLLKEVDIVIIDSYLAELKFYKKISKIVKSPVYIDDNKRLNYPGGIVVNGSIYAKELNYPKEKGIIYFLGNRFLPLRKEFWNIPKKNIYKKVKKIFITLGGSNQSELIAGIVDFFRKNYDFVITILDIKKVKLKTNRIKDLMFKNDVCISGGGQTTYELARCGVPTIGICLADNQLANLRKWANIGFLKFIGWYNDKNIFQELEKALKITDYDKRIKMSCLGQKYIDGQGAKRVVRGILKSLN